MFKKIDEKGESRKMTKNDHQGGPRIAKNAKKPTLENLKIHKIAKKRSFLRGRFFDDFLDGQKIEKRRHDHHRGMSSPGPGLHWGTIGGYNTTTHQLVI